MKRTINYYKKACPFCGGEARLESKYNNKTSNYFIIVKCMTCNASAGFSTETEEDPMDENYSWATDAVERAINRWNLRVGEK